MQLRGQIRALAPSIGAPDLAAGLRRRGLHGRRAHASWTPRPRRRACRRRRSFRPEGAIGWADSAFVPPTAPDPQNALAWIEPRARPDDENAKANNSFLQGPGVAASIPMLDKAVTDLYPFDDINNYLRTRLTFNRGFPANPTATEPRTTRSYSCGRRSRPPSGATDVGRLSTPRRVAADLRSGRSSPSVSSSRRRCCSPFSFFHLSLLELVPGFTLDNYRKVVSTSLYRTYAVNTFLIAAPTALLSVIGGLRPRVLPRVPRPAVTPDSS